MRGSLYDANRLIHRQRSAIVTPGSTAREGSGNGRAMPSVDSASAWGRLLQWHQVVVPARRALTSTSFGQRLDEDAREVSRLFTARENPGTEETWRNCLAEFATTVCATGRKKCAICPVRDDCSERVPTAQPVAIDLFAGAGGFSLAASQVGLSVALAFEKDRSAAATYQFNHPDVPVVMVSLDEPSVDRLCSQLGLRPGAVDVIIAGPPCQGYSIANLRTRNQKNPSNHLWRVVLRFAQLLRPSLVVIENVTGLMTYEGGRVVESIKAELEGEGYSVSSYTMDASTTGVPQCRRRLFVVARRHGRLPGSIVTGEAPVSVGEALSDLPVLPNGNCVDAFPYRPGALLTPFQQSMRSEGVEFVRNCQTSRSTELILERFRCIPQGGNWSSIPPEIFGTYARPQLCHRWLYRRLDPTRPSVTISNFRKNMLIHPWEDRTLSVREAARLQAIPDHYVFLGALQSQQQQVANAVPPPLGRAVLQSVLSEPAGGA